MVLDEKPDITQVIRVRPDTMDMCPYFVINVANVLQDR